MDKGMLKDATSADDSPTPGYMLNEIAKLTVANYAYCTELQEFICSRLSTNNHNVKYKCLVVIKHVCRTGRADFKKEMGKNTQYIKECLNFRGPPDPLRGDEIYKRVRDMAKEALDALFDSQMPMTTSAVASANRIQGIGGGGGGENFDGSANSRRVSGGSGIFSQVSGALSNLRSDDSDGYNNQGSPNGFRPPSANFSGSSSSIGGGNSGASSASYKSPYGSGMSGMGNPNFSDARLEKTWLEKAEDAAKVASSAVTSTVKSVAGLVSEKMGDDQQYDGNNSSTSRFGSTGSRDYNFASNRGDDTRFGGQGSYNSGPSNAIGSNSSGGAWGNKSSSLPSSSSSSGIGQGGLSGRFEAPPVPKIQLAANDGSYERSKVEVLCSATGLKAVPPEDTLQDFLAAAPNLNADIIGSTLEDFLNTEAWQSRVKALIVVEKMASAKGCELHVKWWVDNSDVFNSVKDDAKVSVRNQCSKTLKALGLDASSITATGTTKRATQSNPASYQQQQQQSAEVSLLDSFDPISTKPSQNSAEAASDMFSGMSFRESLGNQDMSSDLPTSFNFIDSNGNGRDSFNSPNMPPPPVPTVNSASSGGFDFIGDSSVNNNSNNNQKSPPPAATSPSIFDAFDSLSTSPTKSSSDSNNNKNSSNNNYSNVVNSPPAAPVTVSAAFDFMGSEVTNAELPDISTRNTTNSNSGNAAAPNSGIGSGGFDFLSSSDSSSSSSASTANASGNMFGGMTIVGGGMPNMNMNMGMGMPLTPQQQQQMMFMQQQQQMMMQQQQQFMMMQQQQRMMQGQGGNMQAGVPLYGAPAMNFNMANRKVIPTTGEAPPQSAFSMAGAQGGGQKKPDSFNFVGDAMKNEIKK